MKEKVFEMPNAEIVVFDTEDVITTSGIGANTEEIELPKVDF